jgi:hypothetical protein
MKSARGDLVERGRDACAAWLLFAGVFVGGCGASTSADGTGSVASGPAQGASHLVVSITGTGCPVTGITTWSVPTGGLTSSSNVGTQIVHNVDGASVVCSVAREGNSFTVSGTLQSPDSVVFAVGVGDLAPSTSGTGYEGTGNISHYAPTTETKRGTGCTITTSQLQGTRIGPGKLWADFSCPTFFHPSSPVRDGCVATGTFVFGNCTG